MNTEIFKISRSSKPYWDYLYVEWAQCLYRSYASRNDVLELERIGADFAERWGVTARAAHHVLSGKSSHRILGDFYEVEITIPSSFDVSIHQTREAAEKSAGRVMGLGVASEDRVEIVRVGSHFVVTIRPE